MHIVRRDACDLSNRPLPVLKVHIQVSINQYTGRGGFSVPEGPLRNCLRRQGDWLYIVVHVELACPSHKQRAFSSL